MLEQPENNYLDGDVVWVKLGSSWWPGQVIGLDKLPEDVQIEFQKKPLIAAVKFFQEDSFEFVKNYQQIYKYNCAQKEDFIKKGLDKFRIKSRDHSNYMIKFPKDVKTAEILTNGDPNILLSEKFNREEKPDVSGLFGEKKNVKKKRSHEELTKKSNSFVKHNITHPRFIKQNDHEIRIRQQPINQSPASNIVSQGIYPCQFCGFTATRVNVIICHLKSHRLSGEDTKKIKPKTSESKSHKVELSNRKYVRKSVIGKNRNEISPRLGKRKQSKPMENIIKKKKSDPELREKLLADWNIDSDDEDDDDTSVLNKSTEIHTYKCLVESQSNETILGDIKSEYENIEVLQQSNKLLKDTENFSRFSILQDNSYTLNTNSNEREKIEITDQILSVKSKECLNFEKTMLQGNYVENKDTKSRLSCFDFDEEDIPESSISNVKKIPRSHKKDINNEFELNQSIKTKKDSEDTTDAMNLELQYVHSSTNEKANIKFEDENNKSMISPTKSQQVFETQVEILEILEIQKEHEEKLVKKEEIIEDNSDSIKGGINKLKSEDDCLAKKGNSENCTKDNCKKDTTEKNKKKCFLENCDKNNSDSLKRNSYGGSNNYREEEQSSTNKTGDDFTKISNEAISVDDSFIEPKKSFFPSVESMINTKTNSDMTIHIDNWSLTPKDDLNIAAKKRRGRPRNCPRTNNATSGSDYDCFGNQISAQHQKRQSSDAEDLKYSEMQKPCEILPETFEDALSKTSNKRQDNITESNEHFQKESMFDCTNVLEHKLTNTDFHNDSTSFKTKSNEKSNRNNKSDIFIDDFNKFEKQVSYRNEESPKMKQANVELLPSESHQIKQLDTVSSEMIGKNSEYSAESEVLRMGNEISSKNNHTALTIFENSNKLHNSKEKEDGKEPTLKNINEMFNELSNDKLSLVKVELDAKNLENSSLKNTILKNENFSDKKLNPRQETMSLHVHESVLDIHESKGNSCLNNSNTTVVTKTFDAIPNLEVNSPIKHSELKNLYDIETVFDDTKNKTNEHILLMNDEEINQSLLSHKDFENSNSNSLIQTDSLLTSNIDLKQSSNLSFLISSSLADDKITIPVKKREKPRIIENVALKEPMILKSKLTEKHLGKIRKHKFELDNYKSYEFKNDAKAKIMKMDNMILDTKNESSKNIHKPFASMSAVKTFQIEENSLVRLTKNIKNKPLISTSSQVTKMIYSQKYTQQNSKNLDEMELDIDSMPFVLSEDVLIPENIEHIPVVMSTAPIVTSIKQKDNTNLSLNDSTETALSLKKKTGTPTILKSKNKAKPIITSIKTIVPPLSSVGHKDVYKINTQTQKSTSGDQKFLGKYVIVQTSGSQEGQNTHRKLAIPACKDSGNAQIVQQGGKVVILTSPQSSSQKMLPFSNIKALSTGRVKKLTIPKQSQQSSKFTFHNISGSKSMVSLNADRNSAPTALEITAQKEISLQQNISKSILMQCSGTVTKARVLNTSAKNIAKSSSCAEIDAISSSNRSIINSKKFFSQKMDTSTDKPSSTIQSFSTRAIIPSQGLISKGTVLTPITGSQVKALAAKNIKTNKKQSQSIELKIPSTTIHKNQKVLSPSIRTYNDSNISSNMIVLQQNKNKQIFALDKKVVQQVTENEPIITETSPLFSSNMHNKTKNLLPNFEHTSCLASSVQHILTEENEKSSNDELLKHNKINNKLNHFNEELDKPVIDKNNAEINENLENEALSSSCEISSSVSTNLSPTTDISKILFDQTDSEKISHENVASKSPLYKQDGKQTDIKNSLVSEDNNIDDQKNFPETQVVALSTENSCGSQTYVLVTVDEQGNIFSLDNSALMSIDGISNEKNRTLYIGTNSLNDSENVNNIILQIENESLSNLESTNPIEVSHASISKSFPVSGISQTANHDILAAALANTDFQQEIITSTSLSMNNFTQTSLINQTILQSTIIPPIEPISSPLVLETSLTLNQPIMTPLEVPSNLSSQSELAITAIKTALNQNISDTSVEESSLPISRNLMLNTEKNIESVPESPLKNKTSISNVQHRTDDSLSNSYDQKIINILDSSFSTSNKIRNCDKEQATSSMPIIDDTFTVNNQFNSSNILNISQDNLENDQLQINEDQDLSSDVSAIQNYPVLETIKLEKPELITNNSQDIFTSAKNNCKSKSLKLKIGVVDKSIENKNEIGQIHLSHTSQRYKEVEEKIEKIASEKCAKTEIETQAGLFEPNNKATDDVLIIMKSVAPFEKLSLLSNKIYSPDGVVNKVVDSMIGKNQLIKEEDHPQVTIQEEESDQTNGNQVIENKECHISISSIESNRSAASIHDVGISNLSTSENKKTEVQKTTHSINHNFIETNDNLSTKEPASKLHEKLKNHVFPTSAMDSYESLNEMNTDNGVPKISFFIKKDTISNENDDLTSNCEAIFPTQNFEIIKIDTSSVDVNTQVESTDIEENTSTQANEIGADIIGTVSVFNSNSGLNEDEIANSSYVPETPENQERDQDQESAISTSSYEILPCEELNIAPSSITSDTSIHDELSNIDNNVVIHMPDMTGISDLPTSSYGLNSNSSVAGIESVSTSNFNNEIASEQHISTHYEPSIPAVNLEESISTSTTNVSTKIDSHTVTTTISRVLRDYSKLDKKEITNNLSHVDSIIDYYDTKSRGQTNNSYYSHNLGANLSSNSRHTTLQNEETSNVYQETSIFNKQCLQESTDSSPTYMDSYSVNYVPVTSSPSERHNLEDISNPEKPTDR